MSDERDRRNVPAPYRGAIVQVEAPSRATASSYFGTRQETKALARTTQLLDARAEVLDAAKRCQGLVHTMERERVLFEEDLDALVRVIRARTDVVVLRHELEASHLRAQIAEVEVLTRRGR